MEITDFSMDYFSVKGKNAIITGGNTGLGQAFSLALAKAGANVFYPSVMPDDPEFNALIEAEENGGEYADISNLLETDFTASRNRVFTREQVHSHILPCFTKVHEEGSTVQWKLNV